MMLWYNPTRRVMEYVPAPLDDAQAIKMLRGHPNSLAFIEEYRRRRVASGIEEALVLTGEFFYRDPRGEQSPE
jgi:hypothetical protein